MSRVLDSLAFSSVLVGAAAATLTQAAAAAMGVAIPPTVPALAFAGTFVVYNVDRLRDLEHDRGTHPARSRFVARHGRLLRGLCAAALAICVPLTLSLGARPAGLLVPALLLGLFHRRRKGVPLLKPAYITACWLLVVLGLPAAVTGEGRHPGWVAASLAAALAANAIASNVRDDEAGAARFGAAIGLASARLAAAAGLGLAALAPTPGALAAVPGATLAALLPFRASERYGLWAVDGALVAGALGVLAGLSAGG